MPPDPTAINADAPLALATAQQDSSPVTLPLSRFWPVAAAAEISALEIIVSRSGRAPHEL